MRRGRESSSLLRPLRARRSPATWRKRCRCSFREIPRCIPPPRSVISAITPLASLSLFILVTKSRANENSSRKRSSGDWSLAIFISLFGDSIRARTDSPKITFEIRRAVGESGSEARIYRLYHSRSSILSLCAFSTTVVIKDAGVGSAAWY